MHYLLTSQEIGDRHLTNLSELDKNKIVQINLIFLGC